MKLRICMFIILAGVFYNDGVRETILDIVHYYLAAEDNSATIDQTASEEDGGKKRKTAHRKYQVQVRNKKQRAQTSQGNFKKDGTPIPPPSDGKTFILYDSEGPLIVCDGRYNYFLCAQLMGKIARRNRNRNRTAKH